MKTIRWTWLPLILIFILTGLFYFFIYYKTSARTTLGWVGFFLIFSLIYSVVAVLRNLLKRSWLWAMTQIVGTVGASVLLIPALYLLTTVASMALVKNRLEPITSNISRILQDLQINCSAAISQLCADKANNLETLVIFGPHSSSTPNIRKLL